MDWNYFGAQIYIGTLMNIKNSLKNVNPKDLKPNMGEQLEANYFRYVMRVCFKRYAQKIEFDCEHLTKAGKHKGYPDCLMRSNNNIFLFEFKDNLMEEGNMTSQNFDSYSEKINAFFIEKGATQLANNIERYINNCYSSDKNRDFAIPFNAKNNIYPVLVYTDYKYCVQGVNDYINQKFQLLIDTKNFDIKVRRRIKPLVFINLDFFLNHMYSFNSQDIKLHKLIHSYNDSIVGQVKAHEKSMQTHIFNGNVPSLYRSLYMPFERRCGVTNTIIPPRENLYFINDFLNGL
jgi:hypothetical protein